MPPPDLSCGLAAILPPILHIEEIFGLIAELRKLTDIKTSLDHSHTSTIADVVAFDTQRNSLEGANSFPFNTFPFSTTKGLGFGDIFLDACCIATSIYMSLAFRNFRPTLPNLGCVQTRPYGCHSKSRGLIRVSQRLTRRRGFPMLKACFGYFSWVEA